MKGMSLGKFSFISAIVAVLIQFFLKAGIVTGILFLISILLAILGLVLGIISLVKERAKKTMAIVGVVVSGILLAYCILAIYALSGIH